MATTSTPAYTTRLLDADTWDDFAQLVEANNGVWGGCWCMGFHPEGLKDTTAGQNRAAKQEHVKKQWLVVSDRGRCVRSRSERQPTPLP